VFLTSLFCHPVVQETRPDEEVRESELARSSPQSNALDRAIWIVEPGEFFVV
jgi:hypothetical protein